MFPFVLTISLSFISFLASAFVILRIVIPILPPHPLSRRVAPSEFGLPNYNFRSLSSADKSHIWLASLDLLALCVFTWQTVSTYYGGATGLADARDAATSARLWFALTIRQTCLLVVSGLTLIHIRMGRSVSFGWKHWMIWAPTFLLTLTSTTLSSVLAGAGVPSFFAGIVAYSTTTAVLSTAAFGGLVYTLIVIKRNLAALNEPADNWPPVKEAEERPRPSFATEDIDALREGSSWLTSDAGSSHHESISNWSFSTHHAVHTTQGPARLSRAASQPSWFNSPASRIDAAIPPVPPLPSIYRGNVPQTRVVTEDADPFRRDVPSRPRLGSQSSWLTSPSVSQATISSWSYPANGITGSAVDVNASLLPHVLPSRCITPMADSVIDLDAALLSHTVPSRPLTPMASVVDINAGLLPQMVLSRPATPGLSSAKVLGGYGCTADSEKGITSLAVTGAEVDITYSKYVFWLLSIWAPFVLSLPCLVSVAAPGSMSMEVLTTMLVLSVTMSSPLLALNIIVRSPIPIPTGLFGVHAEPPSVVMRAPSPAETLATYCREFKKSGSTVTIVEGRRSGDVWISQGDAVDGKGRFSRALGLITPLPRLAVLPLGAKHQDGEITPPLPMQEDTFNTAAMTTPQSTNSAELGRMRKESKASSHLSSDEAFATKIMIAQRHYSAVATTVVVPASPERVETKDGLLGVATGVNVVPLASPTTASHLRTRSISSITSLAVTTPDVTGPPAQPLPPTPPNIRSAMQTANKLLHRKSRSSDFSFGAAVNDDIKEIDALTAGVLPLLVPGLKLGEEIKIRDWEDFSPPLSSTVTKKKPSRMDKVSPELEFGVLDGGDFISRPSHKTPGHTKNHLSLPSLGLDKDTVHTWKNDLNEELDTKVGQYASLSTTADTRRNTVWGDDAIPKRSMTGNQVASAGGTLCHSLSTRADGLRVEIPQVSHSARASLATLIPPSAASTVTLFETENEFEPSAESTPCDSLKTRSYSRKSQDAVMPQTTSSRQSSVSKSKSDATACPPTIAPLGVNSFVYKVNTLSHKSSVSGNRPQTQSGGLRPLTLLKDRGTNKDDDVSKFAGTRPLALGKKRTLKITRDENADPNNPGGNLKTFQHSRSDSSKMRGMLRRNEVLPTVVVRPPSTNARFGSAF